MRVVGAASTTTAYVVCTKILPILDVLIGGEKDVKLFFRKTEEFIVGLASPSLFGSRAAF